MTLCHTSFYFSTAFPAFFGKYAARGMSVDVYGACFGLTAHQLVQELQGTSGSQHNLGQS